MAKSRESLIGAYAFLAGVILAVILGLFNKSFEEAGSEFYTALILIGVIVGFMNSGDKNSSVFLLASLSLVIVGALGPEPIRYVAPKNNFIVRALQNVLGSLLVLFVPTTIIVALKTAFAMSKV
ncbi:hypothetical protein D6829_00435 [Candidatus Pacearchaeota archaeon]|nr:MAG: hypothetical protein D6829_00435 [Candidatus Pacearchaeota archaeon]